MERKDPLFISGPEGLREELAPFFRLVRWTCFDVFLIPMPRDGLPLRDLNRNWPDEARLCAFSTEHRVPSQGYGFTLRRAGKFMPELARARGVPLRLWGQLQKGQTVQAEDGTEVLPEQVLGAPRKGLKVIYSGDTTVCDSLTEAARGADLLICEGTYGENEQVETANRHGHMTFAQAAGIAAKAEVKQLWLTHYSQMIEDPLTYLPNAAVLFENTVCGYDGLSAELRFENGGAE